MTAVLFALFRAVERDAGHAEVALHRNRFALLYRLAMAALVGICALSTVASRAESKGANIKLVDTNASAQVVTIVG